MEIDIQQFVEEYKKFGMAEFDASSVLMKYASEILVNKYGEDQGAKEFVRIAHAIQSKKLWRKDIEKKESHLKLVE